MAERRRIVFGCEGEMEKEEEQEEKVPKEDRGAWNQEE